MRKTEKDKTIDEVSAILRGNQPARKLIHGDPFSADPMHKQRIGRHPGNKKPWICAKGSKGKL